MRYWMVNANSTSRYSLSHLQKFRPLCHSKFQWRRRSSEHISLYEFEFGSYLEIEQGKPLPRRYLTPSRTSFFQPPPSLQPVPAYDDELKPSSTTTTIANAYHHIRLLVSIHQEKQFETVVVRIRFGIKKLCGFCWFLSCTVRAFCIVFIICEVQTILHAVFALK